MADANKLLTVRQIANALGVPKSKVMYMLRTEGITPTARASQTLLFLPSVVPLLRVVLERQIPQPRLTKANQDSSTIDSEKHDAMYFGAAIRAKVHDMLLNERPEAILNGKGDEILKYVDLGIQYAMESLAKLDKAVKQEFGWANLFAGYIRDYAKEIKP